MDEGKLSADLQDIEVILDTVTRLDQLEPPRRALVLEFLQRRYKGETPARIVGRVVRHAGTPVKGSPMTSRAEVIEWAKARKQAFSLDTLVKQFGITRGSAYNWASILVSEKLAIRVGSGKYKPKDEEAF